MSTGWIIVIITLVLGIILSNLLLLRKSAKIKIPEEVLKAIQEKKEKEALEQENKKKPD
ncbi:DUF2897 family protein [Psychromonas aquatilis]|uniref:DUF2897 family protein n=1 Tax=Psychromonas aquatilis TaxID=2005072 RepID=A0ABU9GNR8_9GAMM